MPRSRPPDAPEFRRQMVELVRAGHMETAFGRMPPLPLLALDPAGFEIAYIALFERGGRGRPPVPLCTGVCMQLLDGRHRPEVLLDHVRFYRHFGLKVRKRLP